MMKNKTLWLVVGYTLFTLGMTSLVMQVVGTHWVFLAFLEWGGRLLATVLKIIMIMAGIITIVLAHTDWDRERRESGG